MAPVLSGESHLLVDDDLAAEGVGAEANGDGNDNSCSNVSNHVPYACHHLRVVIPNGTNSGGICLSLRRRCEMVWAKRRRVSMLHMILIPQSFCIYRSELGRKGLNVHTSLVFLLSQHIRQYRPQ